MKNTVKMLGKTTITIGRDTHDALAYIKIKVRARDFNALIKDMIKEYGVR